MCEFGRVKSAWYHCYKFLDKLTVGLSSCLIKISKGIKNGNLTTASVSRLCLAYICTIRGIFETYILKRGRSKRTSPGEEGGGTLKWRLMVTEGGGCMFKWWRHHSIFSTLTYFTFLIIFITSSQNWIKYLNFILLNKVITNPCKKDEIQKISGF